VTNEFLYKKSICTEAQRNYLLSLEWSYVQRTQHAKTVRLYQVL